MGLDKAPSAAERPAVAESIEEPGARTGPEAWHWQPHHLQGRKELWHAMLAEADRESVRCAPLSGLGNRR